VPFAFICALWSIPAATFACDGSATSSYGDVTQMYFSSDGVTAPASVPADKALAAGDCPVGRDLWVWRQGAAMSGDHCFAAPSGKATRCCPGTFATDDLPAQIFARLLEVLERDRFYGVASAHSQGSMQTGAVFEIGVLRCTPEPDASSFMTARPPTPNERTTVLRIVVPFGVKPSSAIGPSVARLLDDLTRAVYQSKWYGQDIY
jgi:hypothetical protein